MSRVPSVGVPFVKSTVNLIYVADLYAAGLHSKPEICRSYKGRLTRSLTKFCDVCYIFTGIDDVAGAFGTDCRGLDT